MLSRFVGAVLLLAPAFVASSYDDRPMNEDDYFGARMQEHYQGQGLYQEPQAGRGRYALILGALAGVGLEWFWTGRSIRKDRQQHIQLAQEFKAKWTLERDALVSRRTYPIKLLSNELEDADLLLLQLVAAAEDAGVDVRLLNIPGLSGLLGSRAFRDTMEYEEFKLPDINNDDLITRQEYNQYIKGFLAMNPETPLSDIPRFEDFDVDRDGVVTFAEWQYYLDQNRSGQMDNDLINELYDFGGQAQNYQRGQGGGGRRY